MPYNVVGLAARVTYGFDNRYFIEGNMGYNGSEQTRLLPANRFGFFPSVSGGWVLSQRKIHGKRS